MIKKRWLYWLVLSLSFTSVLTLIFLIIGYFHFQTLETGTLRVAHLEKPVEVVRDEHGIPHIFAKSNNDAFYTLGFVTAQDRLFQLEVQRRLAEGTLSEIFGEKTIEVDKLFRNLRLKKHAHEFVNSQKDNMNPEMLNLAAAYFDGINQFIATQPLPVELRLLNIKPRNFNLEDVYSFAGYMSYGFSEGFRADPLFTHLQSLLDPHMLSELMAGPTNEETTILKSSKSFAQNKTSPQFAPKFTAEFASQLTSEKKLFLDSTLFNVNSLLKSVRLAQDFLEPLASFSGSNSWVLSPKRSATNHAILVNDPHIGFSNPSIWHEVHLQTPELEIYGHFLSYVPFPLLGHNQHHAWALTMAEFDDLDFYYETRNPKNPKQIKFKNEWYDLTTETEILQVKNKPSLEFKYELGPRGPLISPQLQLNSSLQNTAGDKPISVQWQFYHRQNFVLDSFFGFMKAKSILEFTQAASLAAAPGLNVSYADREGHIGWWVLGKIPERPVHQKSTFMILDGASGKDDWLGDLPFEKNPHIVDPPSGLIVTANNRFSTAKKDDHAGYFQGSDRAYQIEKLLAEKSQWSVEELKKIVTNQTEPYAHEMLSILLPLIKKEKLDSFELSALRELESWHDQCDMTSVGCAIFNQYMYELSKAIFHDKLGEENFDQYYSLPFRWNALKQLIHNPDSPWWDNPFTKDHMETREEIVTNAFLNTVVSLHQKLGSQISDWRWGKIHTIEYVHPFGRQKPLNYIFNIGPYPAGGNYNEIDAMASRHPKNLFQVSSGPSTRRIIDFSHPEVSWGILPTGNSGNPLSPHYSDQAQMFLKGEFREQILSKQVLEKKKTHSLKLISE